MNIELRPCPFCGGEARLSCDTFYANEPVGEGWTTSEFYHVKCIQCGARAKEGFSSNSKDSAAENWNRRIND